MNKFNFYISRVRYLILNILFILYFQFSFSQVDLSKSVNPFIGTGGHGHTFPGAVVPFGMVQLSPDTRIDGSWDGCGGYHFSDSIIYGFSHTHLSGTGVSDWGDILVIPANENKGTSGKNYATKFDHKNENAHAGYYAVKLNNQIGVELTATNRVGIHKYDFKGKKAFLFIDLLHRDKVIDCNLQLIDSVTISGFRKSEAWAREQHCYFTMKLSKPVKKSTFSKGRSYSVESEMEKKEINEGVLLEFDNLDQKPLIVKVALSNVDINGATNNLIDEAKLWDFELYKKAAELSWNNSLGAIQINEPNSDKRTVFYTALYHCFIHPSLDMDVDHRYRGRDNAIHVAQNFNHYNVFSLWDTYRALHPLFTFIEQGRTNDFINTFYHQYLEGKKLPVWELSSNETNCMIGYHSVSVIADAFIKGIKKFDTLGLYKAMKESATNKEFGIKKFYNKRYLEINDESESVSKSLEYAYDNWCIAQMGKHFKDETSVIQLTKTAQAYKNLFDPSTGFMRPRTNGNWYSPFFPNEINNHYTEGNSWHYSFYVPQDINGLIALHGSEKAFEAKLDELFTTSSKTLGRDQADVTGLIGQYAHGNEPSHHSPFLYHYIGKPQKTFQKVNQIVNSFYTNAPDGLIGNDDCGQMSAWYVLASIGVYQVCPGDPQFVLFQPQFDKTEINFEDGHKLTIEAELNKDKTISSVNLNDQKSNRSFVTYNELVKNNTIHFNYQPKTNTINTYGNAAENRPTSKITEHLIVPSPIISYKSKTFSNTMQVQIKSLNSKADLITYSNNSSLPSKHSTAFKLPLTITNSTLIKSKVYLGSDSSVASVASLFKLNRDQIVKVKSKANPQYSADGDQSLVDGVYGDTDWRKGDWLGFQSQDFECVIENKSKHMVSCLSANFLQDTRAWIVFPTSVTFYASNDGVNYTELKTISNTIPAKDYTTQINRLEMSLSKPQQIKFIKVVAKNFGKLPDWHDGRGGDAFIFIDEIEIH